MSKVDEIRRQASQNRMKGCSELDKIEYKEIKPRLKKLNIKLTKPVAVGTNVDIFLCDELYKIYGRKNLCLKVFRFSKSIWGYQGAGGISTIIESTIAQNLLSIKGHCPRVYDLVEVQGKTAQVTDYLQGKGGTIEIQDKRFDFYLDDLARDHNYIDHKLIDLQGTKLKNYKAYKKSVVALARQRNREHGHTDNIYQSTDYYPGLRDTKERIERYNFKDFKNKSVIDLGCSNGMFCRHACDLGAKRVIGLDWPDTIESARELSILDGYYNIDFYGFDLKNCRWQDIVKKTKLEKVDIFLYLAMRVHIGRPEWLNKCKILYNEEHGDSRVFTVERN